jgi:hypothetical protein
MTMAELSMEQQDKVEECINNLLEIIDETDDMEILSELRLIVLQMKRVITNHR